MDFERLLAEAEPALTRFVRFRIGRKEDADDVLQEVRLAAFRGFSELKDEGCFKAWLIGIARRKCADHFRGSKDELPLEAALELPSQSIVGVVYSPVRETLEGLSPTDRELLRLCYFEELSQKEIAGMLGLPVGTVKSRLYAARKRFEKSYPYPPKGVNEMKTRLPAFMPDYTIIPSKEPVFPVKWEEIMGWFIVPRLGERLEWAMYVFPNRNRTEYMVEEVTGRAEVHGIEGVSILAKEYEPMENNVIDGRSYNERRLVAQLTDTHCRILAEAHEQGGVMRYYTFLDGDDFLESWGFGEDNCGNEVNVSPKGDITRRGNTVTAKDKKFLLDVVGRYTVTINGRAYDTVCVMDVSNYGGDGVATEQFLDRSGRTVLWRRFNRNDWRFDRYGKLWTEMFPDNETITVNGETYVHWYDCITDRILDEK